MQHYGSYSRQLSKRTFIQLNNSACDLLNRSWELYPQLRFASAQLLAGSIVMNSKRESIIVNTVGLYGRSPSLDTHRERLTKIKGTPLSSSLPPVITKYLNTWATILNSREGKKLIIGSKSMNALVTSALRIDTILPASIGGMISNFDIDENNSTAFIFLDQKFVNLANELSQNGDADMIYSV